MCYIWLHLASNSRGCVTFGKILVSSRLSDYLKIIFQMMLPTVTAIIVYNYTSAIISVCRMQKVHDTKFSGVMMKVG